MSKEIRLVKGTPDLEKQYLDMYAKAYNMSADEVREDMDVIQRKEKCGLYNKTATTPFGDFLITQGTKYVGSIGLHPKRSSSFDSDGTVDIEITYAIDKEHRGAGIMAKVIKLALESIKLIKEGHQTIQFVEVNNADKPEEHEVFTASAIGTVYANVMGISNYPSLSSSVKAGGQITGVVYDAIEVTFFNESAPYFSKTFTLSLIQCSKTLYSLGFDNDEEKDNRSPELVNKAREVVEKLISQIDNNDTNTKNVLESWLSYNVLKKNQELAQSDYLHKLSTSTDSSTQQEVLPSYKVEQDNLPSPSDEVEIIG